MKRAWESTLLSLLFALGVMTQPARSAPAPAELGTWWKDSRVVRELQLRDTQIRQIEQAFLNHRSELTTLATELVHHETVLQSLIDNRGFDEAMAAEQIDQVVTLRAKLERARSTMLLGFRRAVSADQWKKLQEMQRAETDAASAPAPAADKTAPKAENPVPAAEEPVYSVGGPVTDPIPIQRPAPPFTAAAREGKVEGSVLLKVVLGKDGAVRDARVLRGLGYGLDESAAETVAKRWQFKPATLNGRPVNAEVLVEVNFRLYWK